MATPKERRDARPDARTTGPLHHRTAPADAVGYGARSTEVQPRDGSVDDASPPDPDDPNAPAPRSGAP